MEIRIVDKSFSEALGSENIPNEIIMESSYKMPFFELPIAKPIPPSLDYSDHMTEVICRAVYTRQREVYEGNRGSYRLISIKL